MSAPNISPQFSNSSGASSGSFGNVSIGSTIPPFPFSSGNGGIYGSILSSSPTTNYLLIGGLAVVAIGLYAYTRRKKR